MMMASIRTAALWTVVLALPGMASGQGSPPAPPDAPEAPVASVGAQTPPAEPGAPAPPAPRAPGKPAARPAPPAPPAAPAPPEPPPRGERVNVRVDLRLKLYSGGSLVTEKPLTVVTVGDGSKTGLRSQSDVQLRAGNQSANRTSGLNADVRATVDGKRILLALTLSYTILAAAASPDLLPPVVNMNNDGRTVLEDGKPLIVSEQVDAATDHRLIVEAKATILR